MTPIIEPADAGPNTDLPASLIEDILAPAPFEGTGIHTQYTTGLTAGVDYTMTAHLNVLGAQHSEVFLQTPGGYVLSLDISDLLAGTYSALEDFELTETGFSFRFTAPTSGTYALGHHADESANYSLALNEFTGSPTSNNDDWVVGSDLGETLNFRAGNDFFSGGDGHDHAQGGSGTDRLFGGEGDDTLTGGDDDDTINGGNGDDHLNGGDGRDLLRGYNDDDLLIGQDGNDHLRGGAGNDTLVGGRDNDRLYAGAGNDEAHGGVGNDRIYGNAGDDLLLGDAGKDNMVGGNGNDTINGGAGRDRLVGSAGEDVFVFDTDMQRDVIVDFTDGVDLMDFSDHGLTDLSDLTIAQLGSDARVIVDGANFVVLRNFDSADLGAEDFIFA